MNFHIGECTNTHIHSMLHCLNALLIHCNLQLIIYILIAHAQVGISVQGWMQKVQPIVMVWWQSAILHKNLFKSPLRPQEGNNPFETLWTFTTC